MKKIIVKRAFTMAEILISLSIIGVVAAITIPSLTSKTTAKEFATTYKKAYASIEQALKLASADGKDASTAPIGSQQPAQMAVGKILEDNIGARKLSIWPIKATTNSVWTKGSKKTLVVGESKPTSSFTFDENSEAYMLKDGLSHLLINRPYNERCYAKGRPVTVQDNGNDSKIFIDFDGSYCIAFIDVNGKKGPNQVVSCDNQATTNVMPSDDPATEEDESKTFSLNISGENCTITADSITDVFPVVIFDDKIMPATPAADAILRDRY